MPKPDWTPEERRLLRRLTTPAHIQGYLDELAYDGEAGAISPRLVMRLGRAQCLSGALFACAALRELGHPPRLMFIDAVVDDSHCIALFERRGLWGAVAKSNYSTLRSREPVYPYEALGLSYFDGYFNPLGKRTMRSFTVPLELDRFEDRGWRLAERPLHYVNRAIDRLPKAWQLPRGSAAALAAVSPLLRQAGMLGANPDGLWRPAGRKAAR